MKRARAAAVLGPVLWFASCGEDRNAPAIDVDGGTTCAVEESAPPNAGAAHVESCRPVSYETSPPSSGTHYPSWPVFRAYDKPVPWGFLVHGLEHGAVVIAYNCPDGCADDVAAAKALMAAVPARGCGRPPVILTPDPTLTTRFAAAAWGHILRAPCFDRARFLQFITAHINTGPEFWNTDCGALDLESAGWCPP
ncbi:MAG TPA: DUF3105 domain-containing protein [Polyangia bacterium]